MATTIKLFYYYFNDEAAASVCCLQYNTKLSFKISNCQNRTE